jgi:hypothetical protein
MGTPEFAADGSLLAKIDVFYLVCAGVCAWPIDAKYWLYLDHDIGR